MLAIRKWKGQNERIISLQSHNEQIINLLLESGADLNLQDTNGYTCLMLSVKKGLFNLAYLFINTNCNVNLQNKYKQTAVHLAIHKFDRNTACDCLKALIQAGADLNLKNVREETPLLSSIGKEWTDGTTLLIENGVDLDIADFKGETPLMRAIKRDLMDVAELLIKKGCKLNSQDGERNSLDIPVGKGYRSSYSDKHTSIHYAVSRNDVNYLIPLLEGDADLNIRNSEGETPLLLSILQGNTEASVMLIENGADINISNSNRKTPLMTAIEKDEHDVAILLINKGCELDTQDKDKQTALHIAIHKGRPIMSIIDCLIQHGANINIQDRNGDTPLMLSLIPRHRLEETEEIAMLLLEHGADFNKVDIKGDSVLISAIRNRYDGVALNLIQKGCDIFLRNGERTALHVAAQEGRKKIVHSLLENGADSNSVDDCGETPVMKALENRYSFTNRNITKCIALLIKSGADTDIRYEDGKNPLMKATVRKLSGIAKEIAELFLHKGCNVNDVDNENKTSLYFAFQSNKYDLVELLLQHGADPNIGKNVLHEHLSLAYLTFERRFKQSIINLIKYGYRSDLFPQHDRYPGLLCHFLMKPDSEFYKHKCFLELLFLSGSCRQSLLFTLLKDPDYVAQCESNPEVLQWIESKSCSPMSLQNITRIVILAHIQPVKTKNIKETGLPLTLHHFLKFDDIDDDPVTEVFLCLWKDDDDDDDGDDGDYGYGYCSDDDSFGDRLDFESDLDFDDDDDDDDDDNIDHSQATSYFR